MIDRYTKVVLTVIAAALCGLVIQNAVGPAMAVGGACGGFGERPCEVTVQNLVSVSSPVEVTGLIEVFGSVETY